MGNQSDESTDSEGVSMQRLFAEVIHQAIVDEVENAVGRAMREA